MSVLVIASHDNASLKEATSKVVTAAQAIGGDIDILVAGHNAAAAVEADGATARAEGRTAAGAATGRHAARPGKAGTGCAHAAASGQRRRRAQDPGRQQQGTEGDAQHRAPDSRDAAAAERTTASVCALLHHVAHLLPRLVPQIPADGKVFEDKRPPDAAGSLAALAALAIREIRNDLSRCDLCRGAVSGSLAGGPHGRLWARRGGEPRRAAAAHRAPGRRAILARSGAGRHRSRSSCRRRSPAYRAGGVALGRAVSARSSTARRSPSPARTR